MIGRAAKCFGKGVQQLQKKSFATVCGATDEDVSIFSSTSCKQVTHSTSKLCHWHVFYLEYLLDAFNPSALTLWHTFSQGVVVNYVHLGMSALSNSWWELYIFQVFTIM